MKLILLVGLFLMSNFVMSQSKKFPVIQSGGGIFEVPEQTPVIDKKLKYNIVFDIHEGMPKPDSLNSGLERMARIVNLYTDAGVPKQNINVSAVFHFTASPVILSDDAYRARFGVNNPNTKILNELAEYGAEFYICGQSLRARKLVDTPRNPNIKVVSAAIVYLTTMELKGYSIMGQ